MGGYEQTADKLTNRILALIPDHPEILTMDSAWGLFSVPGFYCDDLGPSLAQAQWSLAKAKQLHRADSDVDTATGIG